MKEKICPVCGNHNEEASKVCEKCGSLLEYQEKRKDYRPIITLIGLLTVLAAIAIGGYLFLEGQYSKAKEYYSYGDYTAAADIFTKIPFYKDSKALLESGDMETEMAYRDAIKLYKNKKYLRAYEWFVDNSYYSDASDYKLLCAKAYLDGRWESDYFYFKFIDDGVNIYDKSDKGIRVASSTPDYYITDYELGREASTNELAINLLVEASNGDESGELFLLNLEDDGFECSGNGYFVRAKK